MTSRSFIFVAASCTAASLVGGCEKKPADPAKVDPTAYDWHPRLAEQEGWLDEFVNRVDGGERDYYETSNPVFALPHVMSPSRAGWNPWLPYFNDPGLLRLAVEYADGLTTHASLWEPDAKMPPAKKRAYVIPPNPRGPPEPPTDVRLRRVVGPLAEEHACRLFQISLGESPKLEPRFISLSGHRKNLYFEITTTGVLPNEEKVASWAGTDALKVRARWSAAPLRRLRAAHEALGLEVCELPKE